MHATKLNTESARKGKEQPVNNREGGGSIPSIGTIL